MNREIGRLGVLFPTRRRALLSGCTWLAGALLWSREAGADPTLDELLFRIGNARATVRTLRARFNQTRKIGLLASEVRSHGTMILVRPDRLRWELDPPDDVTFWMGPQGLAYRTAHGQGRLPDAKARMVTALEDMRTLLGGDLLKLRDRWSLKVVRNDATGVEIEAASREPAGSGFRSLRLALAANLAQPTRIELVESANERTTIEFDALVLNLAVDDALMRP
jgi:outer membrane lipoprotein-sorting protein